MISYPYNLPPDLRYIRSDRIRKTARTSFFYTVKYMETLCSHFKNHPDPLVVPIYGFKYHGLSKRDNLHRYSYDMMALGMISKEEKRLIIRAEDRWERCKEIPSKSRYQEILNGWVSHRPLMLFLDQVISHNRYHDLHEGNVMMDLEENYRLIDLEGFIKTSLKDPENDWIMGE